MKLLPEFESQLVETLIPSDFFEDKYIIHEVELRLQDLAGGSFIYLHNGAPRVRMDNQVILLQVTPIKYEVTMHSRKVLAQDWGHYEDRTKLSEYNWDKF